MDPLFNMDKDHDDWSNFSPSEEQLDSYCTVTGRETFKPIGESIEDKQDVYISDSKEETQGKKQPPEEMLALAEDRLASAKNILQPNIKDLGALQTYIQGEGNLIRNTPRCEDCKDSSHGCLKASRLSPASEQIMKDMEKNLVKS